MPITITMPALSPTMTEGNLAKWLVKEGDTVTSGDVMAEIETDKATMEVEAIDEGTIVRILVPEGAENIPVNQPIAILLEEDEDPAALEDFVPTDGAGQPASTAEPAAASPTAAPVAAAAEAAPAAAPLTAPLATAPAAAEQRIFASPLAKRMAKQAGLVLASIEGSGPRGRIV